jgi:hypothetical protein
VGAAAAAVVWATAGLAAKRTKIIAVDARSICPNPS